MSTFEQQMRSFIEANRLIIPGQSVVAAVSGGPDSICLLRALRNIFNDLAITCVHVDHSLRPDEAARERTVVEGHCSEAAIQFRAVAVDVPAGLEDGGESLEACARRLRYGALEQIRSEIGADLIAVGHSADDQVEEVLLRLIRGSGLKGLSGMRPINGRIVRPLLELTRPQILRYLAEHGYEFCHDSSNQSTRFLRNRIRLELLPFLERRFNPSIRDTILKTARILERDENYLAAESDRLYRLLVDGNWRGPESTGQPPICFSLESLAAAPAGLRRRLFERACWETGCRPDFQQIDRIDALLTRPGSGAELHLPGGVRVVRQHDCLLFTRLAEDRGRRESVDGGVEFRQEIAGPGSYVIAQLDRQLDIWLADSDPAEGQIMRLDYHSVTFPLLLRSVAPGDRFAPLGSPGSRKVARFLVDRKIPRRLRHQHPVLESAQGIVCVLGLEIDERCRITEASGPRLCIRWSRR